MRLPGHLGGGGGERESEERERDAVAEPHIQLDGGSSARKERIVSLYVLRICTTADGVEDDDFLNPPSTHHRLIAVHARPPQNLHRNSFSASPAPRPPSHCPCRTCILLLLTLTFPFHGLLQLYSSADTVILLNAASLQLVRVLTFQEVFPGFQSLDERVSCIAVDPAMKIVRQLVAVSFPEIPSDHLSVQIVASINTHIAAWSMSDVQTNTWRIHSSLVLLDGDVVTALDCRSGNSTTEHGPVLF